MSDRSRKPPFRGYAASRFDEITLAAFTVLLLVVTAAVMEFGLSQAADRIGCGLNDVVNGFLAYPRPCQ